MRSQIRKALREEQRLAHEVEAPRYKVVNLQESTTDRTDQDHRRDIGLDVSLLLDAVALVIDRVLEVLRAESAADKAFIDTSGSTHEAKGEDRKP
jgi:hypothetical protein